MSLLAKRIYEDAASSDGLRVLVDRLWPRGVSKERARVDVWLKEIAPTNELRKWFGHEPERWDEFKARYRAELATNAEAVERLRELAREGKVTLLTSTRSVQNHLTLLIEDYGDLDAE